jgi:uncharacterized protein YcfL
MKKLSMFCLAAGLFALVSCDSGTGNNQEGTVIDRDTVTTEREVQSTVIDVDTTTNTETIEVEEEAP